MVKVLLNPVPQCIIRTTLPHHLHLVTTLNHLPHPTLPSSNNLTANPLTITEEAVTIIQTTEAIITVEAITGEVEELATTKTRLSKITTEVDSEGMDSINVVALCIIRGNSKSNSNNLSAMNSSSLCIRRVSVITGLS
jgi:hypothetical protein